MESRSKGYEWIHWIPLSVENEVIWLKYITQKQIEGYFYGQLILYYGKRLIKKNYQRAIKYNIISYVTNWRT